MKKSLLLTCTLLFGLILKAQPPSTQLSLEQSIKYALENNPTLKNKKLDIDYAKGQVLETTSIGLPQINGSVAFNNNIQLPVFVFPNPTTGEQLPIRVGQNYSTTAGISVNQLLFDGTYLLGLKAANEFVAMSSNLEKLSSSQIKNTVTKSYYLCLITKENLTLLKSNYEVLTKTYEQTLALYKTGLAEKLDADRLNIAKSNLETQIKNIENQNEIALKMLKLNMGMDVNAPIVLSDNLESLFNIDETLLSSDESGVNNRPEYQVLSTQQTLNQLNLKRYKVSMAPSVSAFYNYQQAFYGDKLTFDPWFATSLWGVNMKVPIFRGMNTKAQIDKVSVEIKKTDNEMANFKQLASLEIYQYKSKYSTNLQALNIQKSNMKLAEEVLAVTTKKFENGLGSNIEVISAQSDLKNAQTNYLTALYEVVVAKTDLLKALGKI